MSAHITQEVHYKDGVYKTWTDAGLEYGANNAYKNFILEQEVAATRGEFVIRTYSIPEGGPKELLDTWAHLNDSLPVTMAYSTSDTSFVAICIIDGRGEKRRARKWGDFRTIDITMEPKIMKRLSMMGTKTYLNGEYKVRIVTENVYHAPEEGVITVLVLPTPGNQEKKVDGSFWIRPHLVQDMYNNGLSRIQDIDRRDHHADALMATDCYNARFITSLFTIKGDAEAVDDDRFLNADVVTFDCNLFESVRTRGDYGLFMMFPQEQGGRVKTNRQSIAHFWDLLFGEDVRTPVFGPSLGLVKDAFIKQVNREIQAFESGELMSFVEPGAREEDDNIRIVQTKALHWVQAGRSLNESLYLLMALGQQRIDMWTPQDEDNQEKGRTRFLAPFAKRYSIRNDISYLKVRGIKAILGKGEGFVDNRLGLIINAHDWADCLESLGGGDKDDHAEVHFRIATEDFTFRGTKYRKGDIVLFLVRSPIGLASDGTVIASEYYILKPTKAYAAQIRKEFGKLPEFDPSKLPVHILDLKLPASRQPARALNMPTSYADPQEGKTYFRLLVEAASTSQLVYDKHSALMRNLRLLNIPFNCLDENGLAVKEEFYIDTCTQWRNPQDMEWIVADTADKKGLLPEEMPFTIMSELVAFHAAQVYRFEQAATVHVRNVKHSLEARFDGYDVPLMEGKAEVVFYSRVATQRYKAENGIKGKLSFRDFENIGSYTAQRMLQIMSPERALQVMRDGYAYLMQEVTGTNSGVLSSMYTSTDSSLMAGGMFDLLLKAMSHGPHLIEVPYGPHRHELG